MYHPNNGLKSTEGPAQGKLIPHGQPVTIEVDGGEGRDCEHGAGKKIDGGEKTGY